MPEVFVKLVVSFLRLSLTVSSIYWSYRNVHTLIDSCCFSNSYFIIVNFSSVKLRKMSKNVWLFFSFAFFYLFLLAPNYVSSIVPLLADCCLVVKFDMRRYFSALANSSSCTRSSGPRILNTSTWLLHWCYLCACGWLRGEGVSWVTIL